MSIHIGAQKDQIAESVLLPGDPLRAKYIAENFLEDATLYSNIRNAYGYTGRYKGVPVSVQATGMGMPSIGIYSYELMNEYNVQNLIRIGTAGSFNDSIKINDIVVALATSTDSNYHHAFGIPSSYAPTASFELISKIYDLNKQKKIDIKYGNIVTCDVFYEFENWWQKWADMNVLCVEMEAAALYMNAAHFKRNAVAMVTITDHFITGEKATTKERTTANENMIKLALEVATS